MKLIDYKRIVLCMFLALSVSSADEEIEEYEDETEATTEASISSTVKEDYAPAPSKEKKENGPIIDVDFGSKGDEEYTAVMTGKDTYDVKEKNNKGILIGIAGIAVAALIIVLIL